MNYGDDKKSAADSKYDAQRIAFGPIMFQAALTMRNLGVLKTLHENRKNGLSIKETSKLCNVPYYGTKVLLEAGISLEIVLVKENKYFLTKTGWFLLNDPLTKVNMDFVQDVNYKGFFHLEDSIKNGKPEGLKEFGNWNTVYEALSELPPKAQESWFAFDHYYSDTAFPELLKQIFQSNPRHILDIGGNTGKFSILCAKHNPDVRMTILDHPGQLKKAEQNIAVEKLKDRISCIPMNLLDHSEAYPEGFDAAWMSQFLDCFPPDDIVQLLKKAKRSLKEDGHIYILETYWDKQKYPASMYSLHATSLYFTCMANGTSQMYHSEDMYEMIKKAGLSIENEWNDIGISHTLIKCR